MLIMVWGRVIGFAFLFSTRSHLKNRILAQGQGGTSFKPTDILKYFEELKRGPNTEIGTKDFFEMASHYFHHHPPISNV